MDGTVALSWLDEAAAFSSPGEGVTRLFLSHEHRMLANWLAEKAKRVKLDYKLDDSGNVVLRRPSRQPDAKTLIIGSHQDSVRNGGKYDGMLGIVLPILVLSETLDLPFHVEIIAFGDEEGARFSSTLVGSSAIAGNFDEKLLSRTDEENVTMREAMLDFGLEPQNIADIARSPGDVIGFFEVHIEQGPILEACNTPVGLVTAISSIERHSVVVGGEAGHAGTVPMRSRNDALVKAANIVQFINELCKRTEGLVGVVGKMTVYPNSVNVIPSRVELTIELRSPHDSIRTGAREKILQHLSTLKDVSAQCVYSQSGFHCDETLSRHLATAIQKIGYPVKKLFSGAGHDGLAMHHLTPSAMLFMRCKDGLSHHPDELVTAKDCTIAMNVIRQFLLQLAVYF